MSHVQTMTTIFTMLCLSSRTCTKAALSDCLPQQRHTVLSFCTEMKFSKQILCGLKKKNKTLMKAVNCKSRTAFVFCEIAVEAADSGTLMASFSFDRRTCWKGQSWDSTHLWLDVSSCWPQTIKMELPWKLIVLLSLVECVAGKHPPLFHKYVLSFFVDVWCGYKLVPRICSRWHVAEWFNLKAESTVEIMAQTSYCIRLDSLMTK